MTTTLQISDKIGEAIFVVKVENPDPTVAYTEFAAALSAIGNVEAEVTLTRLSAVLARNGGQPEPAPVSTVGDPLAAAVATAQAAFPGAQVVQQQQPWGNPPVPPFQPPQGVYQPVGTIPVPPQQQPAPQMPGAAAPVCQHGPKQYREGVGKNPPYRPWSAWFCPAGQNDPTRCEKEWIR